MYVQRDRGPEQVGNVGGWAVTPRHSSDSCCRPAPGEVGGGRPRSAHLSEGHAPSGGLEDTNFGTKGGEMAALRFEPVHGPWCPLPLYRLRVEWSLPRVK